MRKLDRRGKLERFLMYPNDSGTALNVLATLSLLLFLIIILKRVYGVIREGVAENGVILGVAIFLKDSVKVLIDIALFSGLTFITFLLIIVITTALINVITNTYKYLLKKRDDKNDEKE